MLNTSKVHALLSELINTEQLLSNFAPNMRKIRAEVLLWGCALVVFGVWKLVDLLLGK